MNGEHTRENDRSRTQEIGSFNARNSAHQASSHREKGNEKSSTTEMGRCPEGTSTTAAELSSYNEISNTLYLPRSPQKAIRAIEDNIALRLKVINTINSSSTQ